MKKLFKSTKTKPADISPLALPPETPIHARHAAKGKTSSTTPPSTTRESTDVNSATGERTTWVVVDDGAAEDVTSPPPTSVAQRQRTESKAGSITSLPHGSHAVSAVNSPAHNAALDHHSPPPPVARPPSSNPAAREPARRKSGQIFPWPDTRLPEHTTTSPAATATTVSTAGDDQHRPPSMHSQDTDSHHHPQKANAQSAGGRLADFLFASSTPKPSKSKEPQYDIEEVIRNLVQSSSEDWTVVFELCESVAHSEGAAKDAARGLRRAFKYAQATPQLMAARLWAVMLRNMTSSDSKPNHQPLFLKETSSRKFMEVIEDVVTNPKTEPVVKERILDVLGTAVYEYTGKDRKHPYAQLWRKLKAKNQPEQGLKLDPRDPMWNPPIAQTPPAPPPHIRQTAEWQQQQRQPSPTPPPPPPHTHQRESSVASVHHQHQPHHQNSARSASPAIPPPEKEKNVLRKKPRDREPRDPIERERLAVDRTPSFPSLDHQIRQVYAECESAHGKARLLSENVALAQPEDVLPGSESEEGNVIEEFYTECVKAQERILGQIEWATAEAERSREQEERKALLVDSALVMPNVPNGGAVLASGGKRGAVVPTKEEEMLNTLLGANQVLSDAIKLRDDWQRAAMDLMEERMVEERSRVETRIDRSQMFMAADGSLYVPDQDVSHGAGPSRSPSPSPRSLPRPMANSSVSSFEEATPRPAAPNGKAQSYAKQQAAFLSPNAPRPESFYSSAIVSGGAYYEPPVSTYKTQQSPNTPTFPAGQQAPPRVQEQPPTPRALVPPATVAPAAVPARSAPHGPRAPIPQHQQRTPSPDRAAQQQQQQYSRELRSPATVAAGALGMGFGEGGLSPYGQTPAGIRLVDNSRERAVPSPPPPGFPLHAQGRHQSSQPRHRDHAYDSDDDDDLPEAPLVPSAKALGKRRAVEKVHDPDAFDPDDMFKTPAQRAAQSPYALPPDQLNSQQTLEAEYSDMTTSDDDEPGHYGHHHPHGNGYGPRKPIVYAYDAAAEREKERARVEERAKHGERQRTLDHNGSSTASAGSIAKPGVENGSVIGSGGSVKEGKEKSKSSRTMSLKRALRSPVSTH